MTAATGEPTLFDADPTETSAKIFPFWGDHTGPPIPEPSTRAASAAKGKPARRHGHTSGCGGCARRWTSELECHCASCHRQFGGIWVFDAHRINGACVDPGVIVTRGGRRVLKTVDRADGDVWVQNHEHPPPQAARRLGSQL